MTETIPVPAGYRIEPYPTPGGSTPEDVLDLWAREPGILAPETAARRVHEALMVAIGPGDELVGVITAHLERSRQLHMTFWHLATFVDRTHRKSYVGAVMLLQARDHLSERHASGEDRRGAGVILEFQHQGLRSHLDMADRAGFGFVGQTHGGHNRWVGYFPGVLAPEPPTAAQGPAAVAPTAAPEAIETPVAEGPVFVVAAPGSDGDALRDALATAPDLMAIDGDRVLAEAAPALEPGSAGARLDADAATEEPATAVRDAFAAAAGDRRPLVHGTHDALRVPFLHVLFPDATFIYLYRAPAEAVPAALAAWEQPWSFALVPAWRSLRDLPLPDRVAAQWEAATRIATADLQRLPPERWSVLDHEALQDDPAAELARVAGFAGVELGPDAAVPIVEPGRGPVADDVRAALARTADTAAVARTLFAPRPSSEAAAAPVAPDGAVRSAATESFTDVLAQIHASLLVSAPGAGAVAILRRGGQGLNTHLAALERPTGMAARDGMLAIATPAGIAEHRDVPLARNRLTGNIRRDACFVPRRFQQTGDLGMGELAFAGEELWLVATRFSCLATLDDEHSFVPRWRPPFVTEIAAEDRCHLNGLCVVGDEVRYVTALGATDSPGGWRERVADGGVVIDVRDGRTVASGLALPCSPRWHRDRLWVLLAPEGALATVDLGSGTVDTVAHVPGFARGLAFHDSLAFVGVSAVRGAPESDQQCGVWVIDLATGTTVAFAKFTRGIDTVADVQILPAIAFPEIISAGSDAARNTFVLPQG